MLILVVRTAVYRGRWWWEARLIYSGLIPASRDHFNSRIEAHTYHKLQDTVDIHISIVERLSDDIDRTAEVYIELENQDGYLCNDRLMIPLDRLH
jgi:hypothetical protein